MRTKDRQMVRVSHHPETGVPIEGVAIPDLNLCFEALLRVANRFPACPWIGWDVVLTGSGFSVLEANTLPNFAISQTIYPFLKDPRTRRIFQRWGLAP